MLAVSRNLKQTWTIYFLSWPGESDLRFYSSHLDYYNVLSISVNKSSLAWSQFEEMGSHHPVKSSTTGSSLIFFYLYSKPFHFLPASLIYSDIFCPDWQIFSPFDWSMVLMKTQGWPHLCSSCTASIKNSQNKNMLAFCSDYSGFPCLLCIICFFFSFFSFIFSSCFILVRVVVDRSLSTKYWEWCSSTPWMGISFHHKTPWTHNHTFIHTYG